MAFTFASVSQALDIANNAMLQLQQDFFDGSDLDDAATPADSDNKHVAMYNKFHDGVKSVLKEFPWSVVSKRVKLTANSTQDIEYLVQYDLPSDYVRLNYILLNGVKYRKIERVPMPFIKRGNRFLTHFSAEVYIDYVYYPDVDSDTTDTWDTYFTRINEDTKLKECIEMYLAFLMALPIKGSVKDRTNLYDLYMEAKAVAIALNNSEQAEEFTPQGQIIEERFRTM